MTLTAGPDRHTGFDGHERRGTAAGPRRSWASSLPFDPESDGRDPQRRAERWDRASTAYVLQAVVLDLASGVLVGGLALASVVGRQPEVLLAAALGGLGLVTYVAVFRGYDRWTIGTGPRDFQALLRGGLALCATVIAFAYLTQIDIPRRFVIVGVPAAVLVAAVMRHLQRRLLHRRRRGGEAMMRTLVVGQADQVDMLAAELALEPHHGYKVVGACVPTLGIGPDGVERAVEAPVLGEPVAPGVPVLGAFADIPQVVFDHGLDVVAVNGGTFSGDALRRLSWALGRLDADLVVVPELVEVQSPRISLRPTASLSLLRVEVGVPKSRLLAKAALDRALGGFFAAMALPVVLAAALAVRLTSPGPAFFRQTRVGVDGRLFSMYKLRSMYVDAEARRAALLERSDRDGPMFKMYEDPRITPVGRVLRRFSIDELPQLFNVVRGDMSLVGPRPPLVDEVASYADPVHRRLHVRPGLTGLWQVSGRADLTWEESVRLDLRYVDNWSVAMDLMILWKTGRAVFTGGGAY